MTDSFYGNRSDLYDRIYHWKDYDAEADTLTRLLRERGVREGARLLEVACGTGNYLVPLSRKFRVAGSDRQPEMIERARRKLPEADLTVADMTDFAVARPYDAVLCLFSSIGYLPGEEALASAARCFAAALRPGGCLIVEPWIAPEDWRPGYTSVDTADDEGGTLARVSRADREGDHSIVEFQWAIAHREGGVDGFREEHRMWLCPRPRMRRVLAEAGFRVDWDPEAMPGPRARGLFLGERL